MIMKLIGIIVARLGSKRLPRKCIKSLVNGLSIIETIYQQAKLLDCLDSIVVATTEQKEDDELEKLCESKGIQYFRGEELNIAKRLVGAAEAFNCEYIARLNADSPILPLDCINLAWKVSQSESADVVSNTEIRTFPYGITVQLIKVKYLAKSIQGDCRREDLEHVTPLLKKKTSTDRMYSLEMSPQIEWEGKLAIDTKEDWAKISRLNALTSCLKKGYRWEDDKELISFLVGSGVNSYTGLESLTSRGLESINAKDFKYSTKRL